MAVGREGSGTIAGADVEVTIRSEFEAPSVMTARKPLDDGLFGRRVDCRGRAFADSEPGDDRSVWITGFTDVRDVTLAVGFEIGMEG